jgi:hypothetical protein
MVACLHLSWVLLAPLFGPPRAMGMHDWDSEAVFRGFTVMSLRRFHELPWWNPYACGGFPSWGYSEGSPNLVSPFLPIFLALPIERALQVEVAISTLITLLGCWFFAGRFTRNAGLRVLCAVTYALNGRFALQIASGHAWHELYAWTPWVLYALDRASIERSMKPAAWGGAALALVAYGGGIYPLPHTALACGLYAVFLAIGRRSLRPLVAVSVIGAVAGGLAAPKLLPIMELMKRFPRKIESTEAIGLGQLMEMLGNDKQSFTRAGAAVPQYGWHEWGIYVGVAVIACMVLVFFVSGDYRFNALRAVGVVYFVLGLGAFHELAPWTLLHKAPIFSSQHVPSRFQYIGVLFLVTAFAAWLGPKLEGPPQRTLGYGAATLLIAWLIGRDIVSVGVNTTNHVFYMRMPTVTTAATFGHVERPAYDYAPADAWAGPLYPAMERNEGFLQCYAVPERAEPRGAKARGGAGYRGEAYFADGTGSARVVEWSFNRAVIEFSGAAPGNRLVYNMNWDPGWQADRQPALDVMHAVGTAVDRDAGRVVFRYSPPKLGLGLAIAGLTMLAWVLSPKAARRWAERRSRATA